jgi:hypothetical protein
VNKHRCRACGRFFRPCPKVRDQQYCSERACQKVRKRRWQKSKLSEDAEYRANQQDARKRWRDSHPDYWRDYRKSHPDYVGRNRELQRERNRAKRGKSEGIAKMDASKGKSPIISGRYQLVPLDGQRIAKMDPIKVKIEVIPRL